MRDVVAAQAAYRCEYGLVPESIFYFTFHMEHAIALKHGGMTAEGNRALACPVCNLRKGSDMATFPDDPTRPIRFFNPRIDRWTDHFTVDSSGRINPISAIGKATEKVFESQSTRLCLRAKGNAEIWTLVNH
ncbi:MAG: HNH endonuclease [Cyclobacteriaceae bacterium]|nr:HNH endonuclease [Cyclobacteriaceae bacterium]